MRRQYGLPVWLPVLLLVMTWGGPRSGEAGGLPSTETFGGFEFNFNNPGARALGMGGAFVSVADDATAVVTNPAGLVILQRPEIAGEVKFARYTNTVEAFSNTFSGGVIGPHHSRDFDDDVTVPSFFSFVYPTERLTVAVFAREEVSFRSTFRTEGIVIPDPNSATPVRIQPTKSDLDITALNFGAGFGLNLAKTHPLLPNIGLSVELSHGVVHAKVERFLAGLTDPVSYAATRLTSTILVDGNDLSAAMTLGAHWRPWKDLSVGAVFRRGPRFEMRGTIEPGPSNVPTGTPLPPRQIFDFALKVPDVYGGGVSYRFYDRLTVSVDVIRIQYSQLMDNFKIVEGPSPLKPEDFKLDDATQVHLGAEHIFFLGNILMAARVGFYTDPAHKIKFKGPTNTFSGVGARALAPGGKDQYHATGGIGIVPIPGMQIDFAVNVSEQIREFALSTVFRF